MAAIDPAPVFANSGGTVVVNTGSPWYSALVAALVWPALILVVIAIILWTRRGRFIGREMAGRVGSIDAFGIVGLSLDAENRSRIKTGIEALIDDYREEATSRFSYWVMRYDIQRKLASLGHDHILPALTDAAQTKFRCTIYVPDLVFEEGIVQLTDYYPEFKKGAGRVIGKRFGHVGRAFRAGESRTDSDVTTIESKLVDEFGMTPDEAKPRSDGEARQSFSCVMLCAPSSNIPVGGVYIDAGPRDAFKDSPHDFENKVIAGAEAVGLTGVLVHIAEEIRRVGLAIDLKLTATG